MFEELLSKNNKYNIIMKRSRLKMDKRKYQYYVIQVKYHNGDVEELNTAKAKEDINNSSYKEMLKVYNEVKELYKDKECDILFCGVGQDGNLGILFTKECKKAKEKNVDYILDTLLELNKIFEKRFKFIGNQRGLLDKQLDALEHKIENKGKNINIKEKEQIFDELWDIRDLRRNRKIEGVSMSELKNSIFTDVLLKNLKNIKKARNTLCEKKEKIRNGEIIPKNLEVHEFQYKDFKDRIRLMQEIQKQFNKITYDDTKKKIYAYNKCGC